MNSRPDTVTPGRGEFPQAGLAILLTVLACGTSSAQGPNQEPATKYLTREIKMASGSVGEVFASVTELASAERLFFRTVNLARDRRDDDAKSSFEQLHREWSEIQMQLVEFRDESEAVFWIVREATDHRRSRGFYVFRCGVDTHSVALQMPHSFFDTHTRPIGIRLFASEPVAAAAWNTVHRKTIDAAHARLHYLNAFTQGITSARPEVTIVQLHGFSKANRSSNSARTADCIVSNGSKSSSRNLLAMKRQMEVALPSFAFRMYPDETRELGGTQNSQGKLILRSSQARFIHLEMSRELRAALRKDEKSRHEFFKPILTNCRS